MDGITEKEAVYGGTEYTDRTSDLVNEYHCNACDKTFALGDGDGCTYCGSTDWDFSPGGVGFN